METLANRLALPLGRAPQQQATRYRADSGAQEPTMLGSYMVVPSAPGSSTVPIQPAPVASPAIVEYVARRRLS